MTQDMIGSWHGDAWAGHLIRVSHLCAAGTVLRAALTAHAWQCNILKLLHGEPTDAYD